MSGINFFVGGALGTGATNKPVVPPVAPVPAGPDVTTNMEFYLDASNTNSYSGTGTAWSDLTDNGNDFTLRGTPDFTSDGDASYFSGADNSNTGATSDSNLTLNWNDGTGAHVGAWIYKDDFGNGNQYQSIFRGPGGGQDILFAFQNYDAQLTIAVTTTGGFTESDTSISSGDYSNQWVYICGDFNQSDNNMRLYRNGSLIDTVSRSGTLQNSSLNTWDIFFWSTGEEISARYALIHVHTATLSAANVLSNYNAMKDRFGL